MSLLAAAAPAAAATVDEVDPLVGTAVRAGAPDRGNTVPGPQLPFGFANPSPDTVCAASSGYCHGANVVGFSQTHVSGTGGAGKYGNLRLTPVVGAPPAAGAVVESETAHEQAAPGYYAVTLTRPGVRVELTATRLATLTRLTFPPAANAHVVLDPGSHVGPPGGLSQRALRTSVRRVGARGFEGSATLAGGWGDGRYTLHFAGTFDRVPAALRVRHGRLVARVDTRARPAVVVRIGLSFVSRARARANLVREAGASFERVRARAARAWRTALARVAVEGGSDGQRRTFATALYHAQLMPHDLTGENVWWRSRSPHYEDFFTLWDTFRTQNPLVTLLEPRRAAAFVQSLVETYEHTGWMPDARIAGVNGLTQVGSSGDVLVADALAKGLTGIDYRTAYRALRKNAEVDSRAHWKQGRQVSDYRRLGYVPIGKRASASRTLEYSYDDFAVARVARALGDERGARRYLRRSASWRNLWDPSTRSIRPRHADGRFAADHDPLRRWFGWADPFYEGSALGWSTFVPHDARSLIDRLGGDAAAVEWLDTVMAQFDASNEPSLFAPWLYVHAGRPDLAQHWSRRLMADHYSAEPGGLPGNDDAGALSAWYVWNAIGLYPNAGQPFYYVGPPLFTRVVVRLPRGRRFTVEAPAASEANRYVVAATLNGRPLERAWLTHRELARGGVLRLELAAQPGEWGRALRPPSL